MSFTFPTIPSVDDTIELNGKKLKWKENNTTDRVAATTTTKKLQLQVDASFIDTVISALNQWYHQRYN